MDRSNGFKSKNIAISGILLALCIISLYLASIAPTGRLSLYALSSLFVSIVVIESGITAGWVFYIASVLLASIMPDKVSWLAFTVFFGIYGLIKYYAEKIESRFLEWLVKAIFAGIILFLGFNTAKVLLGLYVSPFKLGNVEINPYIILTVAYVVFFIIYDFVYSLVIQYYKTKIRKIIFKNL